MDLALGNHEVLRKLGAGGMGEVYLARHRRLGRLAAIKVLTRDLSNSEEMLARFFVEARTTSSIRHPGIVEVLDCDVDPTGAAFIVMEYLEGLTLGRVLSRNNTLSLPDLLSVAEQVADALAAAHDKNIVHRDLKPDNIFVLAQPRRRVKILDFGIAKLLSRDLGPGLTRTGLLMGTPTYMSPEQCRGAGQVDHRTDIYALGCILFQMVTGRPPFLQQSMGELIAAHLVEEPASVATLAPGVPAPLDALIAAMLSKVPDQRPASMRDVCTQLRYLASSAGPTTSALDISEADVNRGEPLDETSGSTWRPGTRPSTVSAPLPDTNPAGDAGGTRVLPTNPTTTFTSSAGEVTAVGARKPARKRGLILGATAGAAVLGLAVVLMRPSSPPPAPPAEPQALAPAPPATAAPEPAQVQINVERAPANVSVSVDNVAATLPLKLPRGSQTHQVVFAAPGYEPYQIQLDGTRDRTVALDMKTIAPESPPNAPVTKPPVAPSGASRPGRSRAKGSNDAFTDI